MSFDLSGMPRYQVSVQVYCPSGWGDSSKTAELSKHEDGVTRFINKLRKPEVIANRICLYYNNVSIRDKFEVSSIKVVDENKIVIWFKNTVPKQDFTNVHKFSATVRCIK